MIFFRLELHAGKQEPMTIQTISYTMLINAELSLIFKRTSLLVTQNLSFSFVFFNIT